MKFKNEIILIGKIKGFPQAVARPDWTHMATITLITEDEEWNPQEHIIIGIGEQAEVLEVSWSPQKVIYVRGILKYSSNNEVKRIARIIAEDIVIVWDGNHYSQRFKT